MTMSFHVFIFWGRLAGLIRIFYSWAMRQWSVKHSTTHMDNLPVFLFVLIMTESIKWQYFEQMCIQDVLLRVGRWKKKRVVMSLLLMQRLTSCFPITPLQELMSRPILTIKVTKNDELTCIRKWYNNCMQLFIWHSREVEQDRVVTLEQMYLLANKCIL